MEDASQLAPRLRVADILEIQAATGESPLTALKRSIACSNPCYTLVNDSNLVLASFGVIPDMNHIDMGSVWLLGAQELNNYSLYFLRHCRSWVNKLQEDYIVLWNYVDARNKVHIRWLKWCGFTFLRLINNHGVEQRPFYEFERVRAR